MAVRRAGTLLVLLSTLLLCPGVQSEGNEVLECRRNCSYPEHGVDLSLIQGVWDTLDFDHSDLYIISLCREPITAVGCENATVCVNISTGNQAYALGTPDTCKVEYNPTSKTLQFSFEYENVRPFRDSYVNVSLICGSRAGVPMVVNRAPLYKKDEGGALIEWVTRAACSTTSSYHNPTDKENKCYMVQNTWTASSGIPADIYDLSPLIKDSGGHQVDTPDYPDVNMIINPCHPIYGDYPLCSGSTACKSVNGTYEAVSDFSPKAKVEIKNGQLQLHYPLNATLHAALNCGEQSGLTINFNCPVGDTSTVPTLVFVSGDQCYHEVVWNTDHACGRSRISNEGCTLPSPDDGTQNLFNLSSDSKISELQNVTSSEDGATYWLQICSEQRVPIDRCPNKHARVAQVTNNGEEECHMIGGDRQTLFYADGVLSLLIQDGDACTDNFKRNTLITFVCDKDAKGNSTKPIIYQGETNHCFYAFEWVTPAACRKDSTSSDCRLTTNNEDKVYEYDFGQLAVGKENHVVSVSQDDIACIQVNLCGKLVVGTHGNSVDYCYRKHVPDTCKGASVCVLLSDNTAVPWGKFDTGNASQVVDASSLILSLKTVDGPTCSDGKRATVIDFVCRPGSLGFQPHFVAKEDECTYKLEWQTAYACPLSTVVGGSDCRVADPKTGSLFDLNGLKRDKYYSFNTSDYEYQINFCGSAVGTKCEGADVGMCQVNLKTRTTHNLAGKSNTTLEYNGGVLRAIYPNGKECSNNRPRNTTIIFECNPEANPPTIISVKEVTHCQYVVTVQTAEACPIEFRGMDCTFTNSSNVMYDLTRLIKHSDQNWEASTDTEVFVINVCRPLNAPSGGCTSASSVCSYTVKEGGGKVFDKSLGKPSTGKFLQDKDRRLTLAYTCTDSNSGSCGVNITFICDETVSVTNGPTFEFMLDGLYHFVWRTPYACPVNKTEEEKMSSSSCVITDPVTNDVINFNTLRKNEDLEVSYSNDGTFVLNVCGPLVNSTGQCEEDAVVCQHTPEGQSYSAGVASKATLSRNQDGTAKLVYDGGDKCRGKDGPVRKTVFLFVCPEHKTAESSQPSYVNESECTYNFIWPTRLACLPKRMECTAGEDQYDLRMLAGTNTIVDMHRLPGHSSLVISLCGPVNLTTDDSLSRCPFGTAACWYNDSADPLSLGEVDRGFNIISDFRVGLELRYIGGSPCRPGGPPSQLLITLVCSEGAEATPELSPPDWTTCNFHVRWTTNFACPRQTVNKNCSVQDPYTGEYFNFRDIFNGTAEVFASGGESDQYNYNVSICGSQLACGASSNGKKVAGCQWSSNPNVAHITGLLNETTVRSQGWGEWLLSFEGGDQCHRNGKNRKTVIHVECKLSLEEPYDFEFLSENECEYYFRLSISDKSLCHGVHPRQSCSVEDYDILALSARGNMEAVGLWDGGKLFLSICQPLNLSSPGVGGCKAGAGACVVPRDGKFITSYFSSEPPKVLSGGRGLKFSYHLEEGNGVIILEVTCDRSTEYGTPIISHIEGLSYNIYLKTRYGCSRDVFNLMAGPNNTICSILNPYNSQNYDLSKMLSSTNLTVNGTGGSTLYLNLCGAAPEECGVNTIAVCSKLKSGTVTPIAGRSHTIAIASDGALEVDFVDRKDCATAGRGIKYSNVQVTLVCSLHGDSVPVLESSTKGECAVDIFVPTPVLCSQAMPCEVTDSDGSYYDLTPLMATIWEGPVRGSTDHFVIGVCRTMGPSNARKHNCHPRTGICLNGDNLGHMTGSPKVVSDGHVTLEYTGGDVCSHTANYSTTVTLICSDSGLLGEPMLSRSPTNNCSFEVTFVTPDACRITREVQASNVDENNCVFEGAEGVELNFNPLPKSVDFLGYPSLSVNFTVKRCNQVIVTKPGGQTKLSFRPGNSTAQHNAALMVFGGEETTDNCNNMVVNVQMMCNQSDSSAKGLGQQYYDGVDPTGCVYSLRWYTRLACTASQMACYYDDGTSAFELSPLRNPSVYAVRDDKNGDMYYINICSPVSGSQIPPDCAKDSAVCVKRSGGSVEDLASITTQKLLLTADNKYVMVQFSLREGGRSVQITMQCGAVYQRPKFVGKNFYYYSFTWSTPYGCREQAQKPVICTCDTQECSKTPSSSSLELSYTSFSISQIKLKTYTFSVSNGTQYSFCACDQKCQDVDNAVKLSVVVKQFVVEDNYLSIQLEGSIDKSLRVTVSLECLINATTELLLVSETNNNFLLTGTTSHCTRKVVSPPASGSPENQQPTSSQASIAVVAVAISIIVAVVAGGCLFVLCKNKQRRYVMKGVFFKIFAVKDNSQVKYRALSQEDREETAVLLSMDRQGDGDSDSESERELKDEKAVAPKLDDQGQELVTDDEMLDL